jgi:hypothetical protein
MMISNSSLSQYTLLAFILMRPIYTSAVRQFAFTEARVALYTSCSCMPCSCVDILCTVLFAYRRNWQGIAIERP